MSFCCISKWNWSDEYSIRGRIQNVEKGETERGFWGSRSWGSREEEHLEPGLERGRTLGAGARERKDTWSRGSREEGHLEPGLERGRTLGAGAREKEWEPGARTRKMKSEPGARTRKKESEPGARERIDAVRKMSMKRRRD